MANQGLSRKKDFDNRKDTDTKVLFKEYKETGDLNIREELIERHLYIAEILSKKYANRGIDYEDIYQVASIGLIYAVDRFDVDKGFEFSSFATPTIIGEIKKYFRDKGWTIRVPRRIQELSKKINNSKDLLSQKLQRSPTVEDIAEYLSCSTEEVLEAMEASKVYTPQSLDITYDSNNDDKDVNLSDLIGEEDLYFDKIENNDFILRAMKNLNEMEKQILVNRFFNKKTQVSIAEKLGISQMTVSRIEKKVIDKFRKEMKKTLS
ncbi:SigB/SigF/SigG family RNA polymerase sigma factor [Anaerosalibacter bizertensis]|uniref:SigB/SigF/SigG family RNA polymerase sigma factor n=1 Tax=Anaerosalibacter bizertensis TaxID=932217 RepID=A0A9Q4FL49_9FIRM|nr:SigB/SigF/SigG family RNA polymerase sigma factor [Anaerosalibacter bizertensis]MBV1817255.1 SigB/SigF/SigG family RNA polymerase sigma factor [Bacteroidales bacterium MSK.15.36]MCB5560134.1 SigB/SigF/SigG family RNA polymerase sigma factor [Anaerosalibacter bizertensis]MCG4565356.1 SigB/SigF/SigG family RNA polymerase sigma factor [Anaerosalibacter bizertensis]MCG4583528.1 SigB/SigF/SigG family RNA polymerase sigma factor [Anaerosalibacter bizertensis]